MSESDSEENKRPIDSGSSVSSPEVRPSQPQNSGPSQSMNSSEEQERDSQHHDSLYSAEEELEDLIYEYEDKQATDNLSDKDEPSHQEEVLRESYRESHREMHKEEEKEYSHAFGRKLSGLKAARLKNNKYRRLETIKRDASNGLSYTRMRERRERTHPRKMVDGKLTKYPIWGSSTGWHCCKRKYRQTDLVDMGVGVCLYFKWLKYITIVFFIIAILSVPSMMFFIAASDGNFEANPSFDTLLALTTIGNLGTISSSCTKGNNLNDQVSFFCPYGTLEDIIEFGSIDNGNPNSNCDSDGIYLEVSPTCNLNTLSETTVSDLQTYFDSQCLGKSVCTIDLSQISWDSECDTNEVAFLVAQCASQRVMGETKENLSYLIVIFDIVCIFFLWIAVQIHGYYEELEEKEIDGAILDGSNFTVDVKNIPPHIDVRILKAQLWRHIEKLLKDNPGLAVHDKDDPNAHKVAQCNFALTKYTVMQYYKLRIYYEKQDRIINLKQMLLEKSDASEEKKELKRKSLDQRRETNKERYELNEERIRKCKSEKDIRAVKVFITMQSMEGKKRVK